VLGAVSCVLSGSFIHDEMCVLCVHYPGLSVYVQPANFLWPWVAAWLLLPSCVLLGLDIQAGGPLLFLPTGIEVLGHGLMGGVS
jgi:hypothetical protein